MFGSFVAALLLALCAYSKEPMYAIAAGLFELSGVLASLFKPKRLTPKGGIVDANRNSGS